MYYGWPSLCLCVKDLDRSTRFYQALGMEVLPEASAGGQRVVLRSGPFRLGLFSRIDSNLVNFRGADVAAVHRAVREQLPDVEGRPERYASGDRDGAGLRGCCWTTRDPDGNLVFFDTNANEEGESFKRRRIGELLRDVEQELAAIGADQDILETFRTQLVDRLEEAE